MALGAAVSTSKTEVEVIVFVAIMLHKVDNDFYFCYYFMCDRIPKISPGTYIFQRPFLRGLFFEGLIFGGAYIRRGIYGGKFALQNLMG